MNSVTLTLEKLQVKEMAIAELERSLHLILHIFYTPSFRKNE